MLGKQGFPHRDDVRGVSVEFEPGDGAGEAAAVHHRPPVTDRSVQIAQVPLDHQNLAKMFHVAAGQRQYAEAGAQLFGPAVVLIEQAEREQQ